MKSVNLITFSLVIWWSHGILASRSTDANKERADTLVDNEVKLTANREDNGHKSHKSLDWNYNAVVLSSHPSCKSDIGVICGRSDIQLDNNLAVLSCVQNDDKRDNRLSKECNHLIWSYKRNLTNDNHFATIAKSLCTRLIDSNADCLDTQTEKVLSPSANLLSCLIERLP